MSHTAGYHLTIKEMAEDLRPRERLLTAGSQSLSNGELLAILLRTGSLGESALELAQRLLNRPGGLRFLVDATVEELSEVKGIGQAKATLIKAALEVGRRISASAPEARVSIHHPDDVKHLLMDEMRFLDREHFRVIHLNTKNHVLFVEEISIGSLSASIVHPRELFKSAVKRSAASLILVHNHPSGDPTPSREDREITRRLAEAGHILGIPILDHIVIGDNRYASLKELGVL